MSLAHDTAHHLATHGHTQPDLLTTADLYAAAEQAGHPAPTRAEQDDIRTALDHLENY